jgi:hypothetical protein
MEGFAMHAVRLLTCVLILIATNRPLLARNPAGDKTLNKVISMEALVSPPGEPADDDKKADMAKGAADQAKSAAEKNFLGVNLGVGFGAAFDLGSGDQIDEATLDEAGVVRIKKSSNDEPRILFEVHKFFEKGPGCFQVAKDDGSLLSVVDYEALTKKTYVKPGGCKDPKDDTAIVLKGKGERLATWGHGPFAAIQTDKDSTLGSFALGYMVGWRKGDNDNSFNLGVGLILDRDVKTLGDGIEANRPLPSGETTIRIKEESRRGLLVFTSFAF